MASKTGVANSGSTGETESKTFSGDLPKWVLHLQGMKKAYEAASEIEKRIEAKGLSEQETLNKVTSIIGKYGAQLSKVFSKDEKLRAAVQKFDSFFVIDRPEDTAEVETKTKLQREMLDIYWDNVWPVYKRVMTRDKEVWDKLRSHATLRPFGLDQKFKVMKDKTKDTTWKTFQSINAYLRVMKGESLPKTNRLLDMLMNLPSDVKSEDELEDLHKRILDSMSLDGDNGFSMNELHEITALMGKTNMDDMMKGGTGLSNLDKPTRKKIRRSAKKLVNEMMDRFLGESDSDDDE